MRLDAPSLGGRLWGTLVAWESDTLVLREDGAPTGLGLIVPADSVAKIDVWRERRLTLEGLGVGLLGGMLLGLAASPDCVDEYGESTLPACLAYKVSPRLETRVAVLGAVGALVGVIVGSETKTARWVPVALGPGGRLAVGVTISF